MCQRKLFGIGSSVGDNIEPADSVGEVLERGGLDGSIKELLNAPEQAWARQLGPEACSETLMPV